MNIFTDPTDFFNQFSLTLSDAHSVVIMSHKNPDDDSISSVLTLYIYITHMYPEKKVDILYEGAPLNRWRYFEHFDAIRFLPESELSLNSYDLFIGVDACQISRFISHESLPASFTGKVVLIDHHENEPDIDSLACIRPDYPACAALLYDILYKTRAFDSQRLPEVILLGILGDTGNFRFISPSQAYIFQIAERLVREGNITIQSLQAHYSTYSERTLFVIQELVRNIGYETVGSWPRFMYTFLDRDFIQTHSLTDADISAASGIFVGQYGTALEECSWSVVFTARINGDISASMRSRPGSVNVRKIGQRMGIGGGHDRAGGLKFKGSVDAPAEVHSSMSQLFDWLGSNDPEYS